MAAFTRNDGDDVIVYFCRQDSMRPLVTTET